MTEIRFRHEYAKGTIGSLYADFAKNMIVGDTIDVSRKMEVFIQNHPEHTHVRFRKIVETIKNHFPFDWIVVKREWELTNVGPIGVELVIIMEPC